MFFERRLFYSTNEGGGAPRLKGSTNVSTIRRHLVSACSASAFNHSPNVKALLGVFVRSLVKFRSDFLRTPHSNHASVKETRDIEITIHVCVPPPPFFFFFFFVWSSRKTQQFAPRPLS